MPQLAILYFMSSPCLTAGQRSRCRGRIPRRRRRRRGSWPHPELGRRVIDLPASRLVVDQGVVPASGAQVGRAAGVVEGLEAARVLESPRAVVEVGALKVDGEGGGHAAPAASMAEAVSRESSPRSTAAAAARRRLADLRSGVGPTSAGTRIVGRSFSVVFVLVSRSTSVTTPWSSPPVTISDEPMSNRYHIVVGVVTRRHGVI